jgi:methionine biosynthesis protein MetW
MPISKSLPNKWFDTPNIHLCTFKDFEDLCKDLEIKILEKKVLDNSYSSNFLCKLSPNFLEKLHYIDLKRISL